MAQSKYCKLCKVTPVSVTLRGHAFMTSIKNDQFCDPVTPLHPSAKINNRSFIQNNRIHKHVTNFKTPPLNPLPCERHKYVTHRFRKNKVFVLTWNYKNYGRLVETDTRWNSLFVKINSRAKDLWWKKLVFAMSQQKKYK